jgi:hypothetical protein
LLLVVSRQGRGVVDLASGELLARDWHETGAWFDAARRTALGIGPLDGARIGVCGLAGGRLPDGTTFVIATPPGLAIYRCDQAVIRLRRTRHTVRNSGRRMPTGVTQRHGHVNAVGPPVTPCRLRAA